MAEDTRMVVVPRDLYDRREQQLVELRNHTSRLEDAVRRHTNRSRTRNPLFQGRCYLCGFHIHQSRLLCREHTWAAGELQLSQINNGPGRAPTSNVSATRAEEVTS